MTSNRYFISLRKEGRLKCSGEFRDRPWVNVTNNCIKLIEKSIQKTINDTDVPKVGISVFVSEIRRTPSCHTHNFTKYQKYPL
jgi:hypothetical protein